jgi:hypothetical protein
VNTTSAPDVQSASVLHVRAPLSAVYSSPSITNLISAIGFFVEALIPEKFANVPVIENVHFSIGSAISTSQSNTTISVLA